MILSPAIRNLYNVIPMEESAGEDDFFYAALICNNL